MPSDRDIGAILSDDRKMAAALRQAVKEALIRHRQAGRPVVEWRDGKTVWIGPEELDAIIKRMESEEIRGD
jgi:hypothetical protein